MLAASMAVGHLLTATEREPPRPPHRHQARPALGTSGMALSQLAWAHFEAVATRPVGAFSRAWRVREVQ
jgi:hypothetical protein